MQPSFDIDQSWEVVSPAHDNEPFHRLYQHHLDRINQLVIDSGDIMEGNMMYLDRIVPSGMPEPTFLFRRQNLCMLAITHNVLVEIGFNAGHSALLALTANPNLRYYGIDIGIHAYTRPCFEYLQEAFGDRANLLIGNSAEVVPAAMPELVQRDEFRQGNAAWCIDGGHDIRSAATDLANVLTYAKDGDVLLFDDSEIPRLTNLLRFHVMRGDLVPIHSSPAQEMYRIMKRMPA